MHIIRTFLNILPRILVIYVWKLSYIFSFWIYVVLSIDMCMHILTDSNASQWIMNNIYLTFDMVYNVYFVCKKYLILYTNINKNVVFLIIRGKLTQTQLH